MTWPSKDSIVTPEAVSLTLDVAGLGSRMIAGLVDGAIQGAALLLAFLLFGPAFSALGVSETASVVSLFVVIFLVIWGYFPLFVGLLHGSTPGKRTQRLRVIQADGQPARLSSILIRNILRIVDFLPLYYAIGAFTIVLSKRSQRVGDMVAGTIVVRERRALPPVVLAWEEGAPGSAAVDIAGMTEREYGVIRSFLTRRATLDAQARADLARKLAQTFRTRVAGAPATADDEAFLEGIARAYRDRSRVEPFAPPAPRGDSLPPPL